MQIGDVVSPCYAPSKVMKGKAKLLLFRIGQMKLCVGCWIKEKSYEKLGRLSRFKFLAFLTGP